MVGVGTLLAGAIAVIVAVLVSAGQIGAASPPQKDIEAGAVAQAQEGLGELRLAGAPSSVSSKQITLEEFRGRLDPFSRDPQSKDTRVWLVVIKGKVLVDGPPGPGGAASSTQYDNAWVLLTTGGEALGWGAQTPGHGVNLDTAPSPMAAWPAPSNPK